MKIGDVIKVKSTHHADPNCIGIIIESWASSAHNRGKAWRIFFSDGRIKTKLATSLEVVNEDK